MLRNYNMNQIEIGKLIAQKRIEKGLTQKQLAECLFVTDKAVSKWERGLSLPDLNSIHKLATLIDVDSDAFIPVSLIPSEWIGIINVNEKDGIYRKKLCGQTVFEYLVSYFLLFGLKHVVINCTDEKFIESLNLSKYGFVVYLNESVSNKKCICINDNLLLVGANLTRKFQNLMALETNIDIIFNNKKLPISLGGFNDRKEKQLGNGYICRIIDSKNFDDICNFIDFFNKNNAFKLNNLSQIKSNRDK